MKVQGKTVLITGASRGIGRAIALEFARQGAARIVLVARNLSQLNAVAAAARCLHPTVEAIPLALDLSQADAVSGAIAQLWQQHGPIDLLVNNAGIAHQTSFLTSSPNQAQEEISVNLLGTYNITRLIARRMAARKSGTIINVSSLMGKLAAPTFATYSATKFALLGFTQALRAELSPHNIRVVALLPSLTETDMVRNTQRFNFMLSTTPDKVAQALVAGLRRGSVEILVGWQSRIAAFLNQIVPWLMEKLVSFAAPLSSENAGTYTFSYGQEGG